jgi:hypothetical protein
MKQVTYNEFFEAIGPTDVHPSTENPYETLWKTRSGQIVGKTIPGWRNYYTNGKPTEKQYWLGK